MAPDNRLERPEDCYSPAAEGATAPAAQTPKRSLEPPLPSDGTRCDAILATQEGRGAGKYLLRRLTRKRRAPPRDSRVVAGHSTETPAAGLARGDVARERGTSDIPAPPARPPPKREGGTGKAKPGKRCSENEAGLSKVDTDTQAQEQERKRRRHSGPQQEKTKLNLGRDRDKVQRQQTQACEGEW